MSNVKKPKVAVQFYGHLRTFEKTYKSLYNNLFNLYDCDVFIHTWDELQHRTKTWYNQGDSFVKVSQKHKDKIQKYYKPKSLLVETQKIPEEDEILKSHILPSTVMSKTGIKYLFYSQYKVNELRKQFEQKNNIKYDCVIVIRPDVELINPLNIYDFVSQYNFVNSIQNQNELVENCRFCPHSAVLNSKDFIKMRFMCASDILYFGSPNAINKTCNFYLKIKDNDQFLKEGFSNPEGMLYKHNKDNNIETCLVCYSFTVDWNVIRMPVKEPVQKPSFRFSNVLAVKFKNKKLNIHILRNIAFLKLCFKVQFLKANIAFKIGSV